MAVLKTGRQLLLWVVFIACYGLTLSQAVSADLHRSEYNIKAALIYNLGKFVRWPDAGTNQEPDSDRSDKRVICILGQDPFGDAIKAVAERKLEGKPIKLVFFNNNPAKLDSCHILFISKSEKSRLSRDLEQLTAKPVLTISDIKSFARMGGMVELSQKKSRIGFIINFNVVKKSNLKMASQLLSLAEIVDTDSSFQSSPDQERDNSQ